MNKDSTLSQRKVDNTRTYWKEEEEEILRQWTDKAQCYEWMHGESHLIYKKKNGYYTIPVIIISTITGTANFAQARIPKENVNTYVMIVGGMNLIAGIITTVYQFLKISELNEAYRVAQLSWGKFYRNIKTELAKHPLDRTPPNTLLKIAKEEFDRLLEISPPIPESVVQEFKKQFKNETEIVKPEICDVMMPTHVYEMTDDERLEMITQFEKRPSYETVINIPEDPKLEDFKNTFYQMNNRYPTEDEINDNFNKLFSKDESEI
jgi:hypothetical protein